MNFFNGCLTGKSKLKVILTSNCFKSKNLVFNINTEEQNMEKLFDEIKKVIDKYNSE